MNVVVTDPLLRGRLGRKLSLSWLAVARIGQAVEMSESSRIPIEPRGSAAGRSFGREPARFCWTSDRLLLRCYDELKLPGLQLHFSNSAVDLTIPEHLARIQELFAHCAKEGIPIVLHFRSMNLELGRNSVRKLRIIFGLGELRMSHLAATGFSAPLPIICVTLKSKRGWMRSVPFTVFLRIDSEHAKWPEGKSGGCPVLAVCFQLLGVVSLTAQAAQDPAAKAADMASMLVHTYGL